MRTSVRAEYALQAVFDLSCQPSGTPIKIASISRRQKIPQKFLELILATLRQAGLVESRRGAEGGYMLARASEAITVGQVLRAIEGGKPSQPRTRGGPDSPFGDLWRRVDEATSGVVDRTNFAELVRSWQDKQQRFVANWEI